MADDDKNSLYLAGSMDQRTFDAVVALGTKVDLYLASIEGVRADVKTVRADMREHDTRLRIVETRTTQNTDAIVALAKARVGWFGWTPLLLGCIAGVVSAIGYYVALTH